MNETLKTISDRRSHRAYESTPLTKEQLDLIMTAAVQSPSAVNRQPWHFSVTQNQQLLDEINDELRQVVMRKSADQRSPRFADESFHVFYHAPCVIFISGDPDSYWTRIDCGIATQTIALAAESLGLGSVVLGLPREAFSGERAAEFEKRLQFPDGWHFVIAVAIGTPTDTKDAHPVQANKVAYIE